MVVVSKRLECLAAWVALGRALQSMLLRFHDSPARGGRHESSSHGHLDGRDHDRTSRTVA